VYESMWVGSMHVLAYLWSLVFMRGRGTHPWKPRDDCEDKSVRYLEDCMC
jgi:hypothetical protein